jgi:O-antigen/teichoic acid export membrane protein
MSLKTEGQHPAADTRPPRSAPNGPTPAEGHSDEIRSIARGAGIVLLGTIAGSGLKYLFEFIVARRLGPALFGVFFLGMTVFNLAARLGALELNSGLLRFVSLYKGENKTERVKGTVLAGLRIALLAGSASALLLIAFSGSWLGRALHAGQLSQVLKLLSIGVIFTAATEILVYSMQALGAVEYRVWVRSIFEPALSIVLALVFLNRGWGLSGAVLAYLAPLVLGTLLAFGFLRRVFPPLVRKDVPAVSDAREIIRFSLPLLLAGLLSVFMVQINPLILGYFRPSAEVGVFGAAQRTALLLPLVLDSFNAVFAPMIADLTNRRALDKLEALFKIVTKWILALSFPVFLMLVFYGKDILSLWGKGYREGLACLIVIAAGQFVNCATGPVGYMISMSGRPRISLANTAGVLALNVALNILLIPRYGIMGSAFALALSLALVNLVRLVEVRWLLKIHPYRWDSLKPLAAGSLALLVLVLAESSVLKAAEGAWRISGGILLFCAGYASILAAFGIGAEEKLVFSRIRERIFRLPI